MECDRRGLSLFQRETANQWVISLTDGLRRQFNKLNRLSGPLVFSPNQHWLKQHHLRRDFTFHIVPSGATKGFSGRSQRDLLLERRQQEKHRFPMVWHTGVRSSLAMPVVFFCKSLNTLNISAQGAELHYWLHLMAQLHTQPFSTTRFSPRHFSWVFLKRPHL